MNNLQQHKPLVFLGTNSNLLLYIESAERLGIEVAGIVDSDYFGNTKQLHGLPILGSEHEFADPDRLSWWKERYCFFIGTNWSPDTFHVRDVNKRLNFINLIRQYNIEAINLIDPSAFVSKHIRIGQGVYIGPLTCVEPDVEIHDFAQLYYQVGLGHGSIVGENTVLQRRVALTARIGKNSYIGMWAKIFRSKIINIGDNVIVSPGLFVSRDLADNEVVKLTKDSIRIYQFMSDPDVANL